MFVADRLVFLEFTKTGCSHVNSMLAALIPGRQIGKHNSLNSRPDNRLVVGSIRNPWDWYVSLWAFGCMQRGMFYHRVTEDRPSENGWKRFLKTEGSQFANESAASDAYREYERHRSELWRQSYGDGCDVECFRKWLGLMFDPERRFDSREGYGRSSISAIAGFMTFRYLWLFSLEKSTVLASEAFGSLGDLRKFDAKNNLLNAVIRMEHLEDDLLAVIAQAGYELTPAQRELVFAQRSNKRNQSKRLPMSAYYDSHSVKMVAEREALLIEKYGYEPPNI